MRVPWRVRGASPARRAPAPVTAVHHLDVDGRAVAVDCTPATSLLAVLRDHAGLVTVKASCGSGECGTCTVLVGDVPMLACATFVGLVDAPVRTAAGLAEEARALRAEMADRGAFQCGFCTPGQVVTGHVVACALAGTDPGRDEVAALLSGVLCRCTGSGPIVDAVLARLADHADGAASSDGVT